MRIHFCRKVLWLEALSPTVTSLYYFTGAQFLARVCVAPVYLIWWASCSMRESKVLHTHRRPKENEHQIWMPMSWSMRVHEHMKQIIKSNWVRYQGGLAGAQRKKNEENSILHLCDFEFSVFDYHTDTMHCIRFARYTLFFFRWIRRCERFTFTNTFFAACRSCWVLTVCYRCSRNKIRCAIFPFFIRNGLHFILFSWIFWCEREKNRIISVTVRAVRYTQQKRTARNSWYSFNILHSLDISLHFISFYVI